VSDRGLRKGDSGAKRRSEGAVRVFGGGFCPSKKGTKGYPGLHEDPKGPFQRGGAVSAVLSWWVQSGESIKGAICLGDLAFNFLLGKGWENSHRFTGAGGVTGAWLGRIGLA